MADNDDNQKRIVEINGLKLEVDLRNAVVVQAIKIGDRVKVLVKEYSGYKSYPGVVVGFDAFEKLPTIIIAYLEISYSEAKLKTAYFNAESNDVEIVLASGGDIPFERDTVLTLMDKEITKKERELEEARFQKEQFVNTFSHYFRDYEETLKRIEESSL